jgi:hypothetical protein
MSPSPKPRNDSRFNLNTALIICSLAGCFITAVFYIAPLRTLPDDVKGMQVSMVDVQRTQAIQTEALKTLAVVTKDSKDMRREFDRESAKTNATLMRHDAELDNVRKKLERLGQ